MRAGIVVPLAVAAAFGLGAPQVLLGERLVPSAAAEDWRAEFDDICSKTQDAMSLGTDELRTLVDRCDRLRPAIDKLDPSVRKVYTRRLEQCRALYRFVLESRGAGATG